MRKDIMVTFIYVTRHGHLGELTLARRGDEVVSVRHIPPMWGGMDIRSLWCNGRRVSFSATTSAVLGDWTPALMEVQGYKFVEKYSTRLGKFVSGWIRR